MKKKTLFLKILPAVLGTILLALLLVIGYYVYGIKYGRPAFSGAPDGTGAAACRQHVRLIAAAKEMAVLDNDYAPGEMIPQDMLEEYLERDGGWPVCPEGGTYSPNPVATPPACSRHSP